jgi:hypothetical protein
MAAAVSFARFTGEKHFLSDILVGSAMGFGIGKYVYHAHHRSASNSGGEEDLQERDRHWPAVAPLFDSHAHSYGLGLTWSF